MADIDDNVKERYDEFVERLTQFSTTPIKDFAVVKPQIFNILKTHRPIKTGDYQYGFSKTGKKKCQLIVHEFNQRSKVREYFKVGKNDWHCCECNRIGASTNDLVVAHGFLFVKLEHECQPRELSFVLEIQKLYKDGKFDEAVALQKSVLGSEDLNILSTKKVAVKRDSKLAKKVVSKIGLQYAAAVKNENVQVLQPSIMDEQNNEIQKIRSPEIVFAEIIENLKEYTTENVEKVVSKKSKILRLLKNYRPLKIIDCQYGLSESLQIDRRLIVFEWNDKKKVREYSRRSLCQKYWECLQCYRLYQRRIQSSVCRLHLISNIVFVPINHANECKPRDYELVMQYQKFLEEGDTTKAKRMGRIIDFTYGQNTMTIFKNSLDLTVINQTEEETLVNNNESNSKTLTNLKRKLPSTVEDEILSVADIAPVHKKSKHKKNKENHVDEKADPPINQKLKVINEMEKAEPTTIIATTSIFAFEKPSTLMLEEICAKLNIQYRNRAMKLWDEIMFEQIDTVSIPSTGNIETHEFQTENFYEILSKLFTAKFKHHQQVEATIFEAFKNKLVESGEISSRKFDKLYAKDTVTDRHLSFIAKFLPCRILIFDGEKEIRKYGKWKETSRKRVTLVSSFLDGLYSIVLNL